MKLPFRARIVVLLAWTLRAVRMIGTPDYEHLKFNLWLEADLKARGVKVTNVTQRSDYEEAAR